MRTKIFGLFAGFILLRCLASFAGQSLAPDSPAPVMLSGDGWKVYALQAAFKPVLSMSLAATNSVKIFWPASDTNFNLVFTTNSPALVKPPWLAPVQSVQNDGVNKFILVTPSAGVTYYKLEIKK